jgi:trimethylamine--corrinoid protein Co-methyltransferase
VGDVQAGVEKTLTALTPALAGANIIYGLGMLEMGVTFCFRQLLMDADVADMIKFTLAGIPVTDATLSVDIIREIGHSGNFLSHKNTFANRMIQSKPALIDRNMRGRWEDRGSTTMHDRAGARLKEILATHRVPDLSPRTRAAVRAVVNEAESRYGVELSDD